MAIATSVESYLKQAGVSYDVIAHQRTATSSQTAQAAHVPGDRVAKCVMLEDSMGYLMAILPATHRVDLGALHQRLGRQIGLASEGEFTRLFSDCAPGAVPPLGRAYGVEAVVDESLVGPEDVYFEAGDHCALLRMSGRDFMKLMGDAPRVRISSRN